MAKGAASVTNLQDHRDGGKSDSSILAQPDERFRRRIVAIAENRREAKSRRAEIQAELTADLEGLNADTGANKKAVLAAIHYANLDDKARQNWDLTFQAVRVALGCPMQGDLFDAQLERGMKQEIAKAKVAAAKDKAVDPKAQADALFVPGDDGGTGAGGAEAPRSPSKLLPGNTRADGG
jgi:hypothetical protein